MIRAVWFSDTTEIAGTAVRALSSLVCLVCPVILLAANHAAHAQAEEPTLFVGNNGNIEGSISSLRINEDGSLTLIDTLILGEVDSSTDPCPGCNTYTLSLSPDGQYLVGGHPTSDIHPVHVSITRVNRDSTLDLVGLFSVPSSPLSVGWLDNEHFAVTRTSITGINEVRVYRFDEISETISFINSETTGGFTSTLAVDRENNRVFAERSSGGNAILSYSYDAQGNLTPIQAQPTGTTYALGIGLAPDGARIYGGGGISNGGNKIVGMRINLNTGAMGMLTGSPFTSPGASPKQVVVSDDGAIAIAGHGTDATVRTFAIDPDTGALTSTGHFFDVGTQGTLGDTAAANDLVFCTDTSTVFDGVMGVYSFTLEADGSLTQNGSIVDTGGVAPRTLAPWFPDPEICPGDMTGSGEVNVDDLLIVLNNWGPCDGGQPGCPGDATGSGEVNVDDLLIVLNNWGPCN